MKHHHNLPIAAALACFFISMTSCRKATDFLRENPTDAFCPCQITKFSYTGTPGLGAGGDRQDTLVFTYNNAGDPLTVVRAHPSTGYPHFFFRYDSHGRLTDLIGGYNKSGLIASGSVETWNRFFYDTHGRITSDSLYFFPGVVNDRPMFHPLGVTTAEMVYWQYDSQNRISREDFHSGSMVLTSTFTYDSHGNLAGHSYDDKINYHRTSTVWMFLDKDYSVNNPITATYIYNQFGLPVSITTFPGTIETFLTTSHTSNEFGQATIQYHCNEAAGKQAP